jgi:hypothetical protein
MISLLILYFIVGIGWITLWYKRVEPFFRKWAEVRYGVKIRFWKYWRVTGETSFINHIQLFFLEMFVMVGLAGGGMLLILSLFLLIALPLVNP